jgi:hypothetical protein
MREGVRPPGVLQSVAAARISCITADAWAYNFISEVSLWHNLSEGS